LSSRNEEEKWKRVIRVIEEDGMTEKVLEDIVKDAVAKYLDLGGDWCEVFDEVWYAYRDDYPDVDELLDALADDIVEVGKEVEQYMRRVVRERIIAGIKEARGEN